MDSRPRHAVDEPRDAPVGEPAIHESPAVAPPERPDASTDRLEGTRASADPQPPVPADGARVRDTASRESPADRLSSEPPRDLRQAMLNNSVFARDGWGQQDTEAIEPREQKAASPTDGSEESVSEGVVPPNPDRNRIGGQATESQVDGADDPPRVPARPDPESAAPDLLRQSGIDPDVRGGTDLEHASPADEPTPDVVDQPEPTRGNEAGESTGEAEESTAASEVEDRENESRKIEPSDSTAETAGESSNSPYADVVAEHDEHWENERAQLPPSRLPESARSLSAEDIEAMSPDVRRGLEYQGAVEYIAEKKATRPWLEAVDDAPPAVQRIFTAIDQGTGHAHIRHGPMGDDQMYADRVAYLQDPAQTDPAKREVGLDGLNQGKKHRCGQEATRIHDADAFVAAYAAAVNLPDVQAALATPLAPTVDHPDPVKVPISALLGPDGHKYCSGYRLEGGAEAMQARKEWLQARVDGVDLTGMPEPSATRIETFEGGNVVIRFKSNGDGYEINTLFVEPPADN
jgi:hypothetical protein